MSLLVFSISGFDFGKFACREVKVVRSHNELSSWWSPSFVEIESKESLFIEFSPEVVSHDGKEISAFVEQIHHSFLLIIIVNHISHLVLSKENRGFTITGVKRSEIFSFDVIEKIVSYNMNLVESSPESFGGRQVSTISESKYIFISSVLEGFSVNIQ